MVDILLTKTRVTEARKRTQAALADEPATWDAFDQWHFQRDALNDFTQADLAARLGMSLDHLEGLLRRGRDRFKFQFVSLVASEVSDPEQMAEELGVTRELLEKELARFWKSARRGRKGGARGE